MEIRDGEWCPSSQAFLGGSKRCISVDRAALCGEDPTHTQVDDGDFVCWLNTGQVHSIDTVVKKDSKNQIVDTYEVRVESTPREGNDAHADVFAQLESAPTEIATKGAFRQLKEELAGLAKWVDDFAPEEGWGPPDKDGA